MLLASLSLLQSSHLGFACAQIMYSHCPHGKEHVITCLALLFLASGTAPDLIHEPKNSLLSPSLSKNSADMLQPNHELREAIALWLRSHGRQTNAPVSK